MIIVGKECPQFQAHGLLNNQPITITQDSLKGRYTLLFFYPLDFSAVCPTELRALQKILDEFSKRKVDVITISCDSIYIHAAFAATLRSEGKGVPFTMISDQSQQLSKLFGVFDQANGVSLRGTFIIDENLIIQYGQANNLAFGRSMEEIVRVIDAIQFSATHDTLCPVNWKPGETGIKKPV
ncbi:MAG: peroxiredoxin [Parachlamydiales bacterium]|nr:peroxiredoxin [Parachlamydiales bacterium]